MHVKNSNGVPLLQVFQSSMSAVYDSLDRLRQSTSDAGTPADASDDVVTTYQPVAEVGIWLTRLQGNKRGGKGDIVIYFHGFFLRFFLS
jgi:acetyl esterase/lipase